MNNILKLINFNFIFYIKLHIGEINKMDNNQIEQERILIQNEIEGNRKLNQLEIDRLFQQQQIMDMNINLGFGMVF